MKFEKGDMVEVVESVDNPDWDAVDMNGLAGTIGQVVRVSEYKALIQFGDKDLWVALENLQLHGQLVKQEPEKTLEVSDGSTASYYVLPEGAEQLQDLISFRNMNAQMGEIFRATYRYGQVEHSPMKRDIKKIIFYATKELERLEKYES